MAARQVTQQEYLREYIRSTLQRWAKERGDDVEIVASRPRPLLATSNGNVVVLRKEEADDANR